jgi:hypothetical protein
MGRNKPNSNVELQYKKNSGNYDTLHRSLASQIAGGNALVDGLILMSDEENNMLSARRQSGRCNVVMVNPALVVERWMSQLKERKRSPSDSDVSERSSGKVQDTLGNHNPTRILQYKEKSVWCASGFLGVSRSSLLPRAELGKVCEGLSTTS